MKILDGVKQYLADKRHTKLLVLILLIEIVGIGLFIMDYVNSQIRFDGVIERKDAGKGDLTEDVIVSTPDYEEAVLSFEVSEQEIEEEEANALIDAAIIEIDETFPGENKSCDEITMDVCPADSYQNGRVLAEWSFSDYEQVNTDGSVHFVEGADALYARATLSCGTISRIYEFPLRVLMPDSKTRDGFLYYLTNYIEELNDEGRASKELSLPAEYEGRQLTWKEALDYRGVYVMLLGLATLIALIIGDKEEEKKRKAVRDRALMSDYPIIVSQLSLYVGAGLSVREAMHRIERHNPSGDHPGMELISRCIKDMSDGRGEMAAYERLGSESGHRSYRKLSLLLCQNLRKGNAELLSALEREEMEAFEERKARAKVAGEEASTKLLLPMMMMLVVVLVIMVVPALISMD